MGNPKLLQVFALLAWAQVRTSLRRVSRPKEVFLFLAGLGVTLLWVAPWLASEPRQLVDVEIIRLWGPAVMMVLFTLAVALGVLAPGFYFTVAEIELLWPAPISRQALILWKAGRAAAMTVGLCVVIALFAARYGMPFIPTLSCIVIFGLWTLGATLVGILIACHDRASPRVRRAAALLISAPATGMFAHLLWETGSGQDVWHAAETVLQNTAWRIALLPFTVPSELIVCSSVRTCLAFAAAGGGLVVFPFWVLSRMRIDDRKVTHGLSTRIESAFALYSYQAGWRSPGSRLASSSLRMPPYWGGFGPHLWRRAIHLMRAPGPALLVLACSIVMGLVVVSPFQPDKPALWLPMFAGGLTFLGVVNLRYDFRADLNHLDLLRQVPQSPRVLGAAAVILPTIVLSVSQVTLAGFCILAWPELKSSIASVLIALPFLNLLLITFENAFWLVLPNRRPSVRSLDLIELGRSTVLGLVKLVTLIIVLAILAGIGMGAWFGLGHRVEAVACVVAVSTIALSGLALLLLGFLFKHAGRPNA